MLHVEWKCTKGWAECDKCNYDTHSELFVCAVCGGFEGILPTECPGRRLTEEEENGIYKKNWDFKNNEWTKGNI